MKIQEIQQLIEENSDLGIDLDKEARKIPKLHGKLINTRSNEIAVLRSLELEYDVVKKERWVFYSGKAEPEVYRDEPFQLKILKTDMDIFENADSKLQKIRSQMETQRIKIDLLDGFIKMILQRSFIIKNIIDWNRLQQGLV